MSGSHGEWAGQNDCRIFVSAYDKLESLYPFVILQGKTDCKKNK